MASWFANTSVRPLQSPRLAWGRQEEESLLLRMGYADLVALGTLRLVSIYSTFDSPREVGLTFQPEEVLYQSAVELRDQEGEVGLQLDRGADDFLLTVNLQGELTGRRYLLFLKAKPAAGGGRSVRWTLYNEDPLLLRELRALYAWHRRQGK